MGNSSVKMLPVGHGDAFIINCFKGDSRGVVVVDGGPQMRPVDDAFQSSVDAFSCIDLMVLSHIDDDHISGILDYIERHKSESPFPVKEIWANCAPDINLRQETDLSPKQGFTLSDRLSDISARENLIWRADVCFGAEAMHFPFADIRVLTPTRTSLEGFINKYRGKKPAVTGQVSFADASATPSADFSTDMHRLAARPKKPVTGSNYAKAVNIAAISFILECDGLRVLMCGDAYAIHIAQCLRELGYSEANPLELDFLKVPHHGSAPNMHNDLLALVKCNDFLISTNGDYYSHPDREAIANILCHPQRDYARTVRLHFNYPLRTIDPRSDRLFNPALDKDLNYEIIID